MHNKQLFLVYTENQIKIKSVISVIVYVIVKTAVLKYRTSSKGNNKAHGLQRNWMNKINKKKKNEDL